MSVGEIQLLANIGIGGIIAIGVLRLLYREVPKVAEHLKSIDRRLARLLERRGIPDSVPPPDDDDTSPGRPRRGGRPSLFPRLPTVPRDDSGDR